MGRVARYKKVKSFDPYSKKNNGRVVRALDTVGVWGLGDDGRRVKKRSRTAEVMHQRKLKRRAGAAAKRGKPLSDDKNNNKSKNSKDNNNNNAFDLPPDKEEDDFDLADMVGSIKRESVPSLMTDASIRPLGRTVQLSQGLQATIPQTEREEKKVAKMLNIKPDSIVEAAKDKALGRMEGESKRAFNKRVKSETRQIIRREHQEQNNPEKRKRKKEFLAEKKKKKKAKTSSSNSGGNDGGNTRYDDDDDDDDNFVTGERAKKATTVTPDVVRFGEQAERPPDFRQLPRGAKKQQHPPPKKNSTTATNNSSNPKQKALNEQQIAAEQLAMENLRRKVQAQYAVIKMKRKLAGDFHL